MFLVLCDVIYEKMPVGFIVDLFELIVDMDICCLFSLFSPMVVDFSDFSSIICRVSYHDCRALWGFGNTFFRRSKADSLCCLCKVGIETRRRVPSMIERARQV